MTDIVQLTLILSFRNDFCHTLLLDMIVECDISMLFANAYMYCSQILTLKIKSKETIIALFEFYFVPTYLIIILSIFYSLDKSVLRHLM